MYVANLQLICIKGFSYNIKDYNILQLCTFMVCIQEYMAQNQLVTKEQGTYIAI